jgi:hypothetical protein
MVWTIVITMNYRSIFISDETNMLEIFAISKNQYAYPNLLIIGLKALG